MVSVGQGLLQVLWLGVFAVLFLGPIHLFVTYRLRRAQARGRERAYVAHADPWLRPLIAATGAVLIFLARLLT